MIPNGPIEERPTNRQWISDFTKTPLHTGSGDDIICPHFRKLVYVNGCPFDCAYCYLRKTLRWIKGPVIWTNWKAMVDALSRDFGEREQPTLYNTGELGDSLAFDRKYWFADILIQLFASQEEHTVLFLTKSINVDAFFRHKPSHRVIVSFSVTAPSVWARWEAGTPDPWTRIAAAKALADRGWRVRLRLDPMVPGFDEQFAKLAWHINTMPVERVTIGSLRALPGLEKLARDNVMDLASEVQGADNRRRIPEEERLRLYWIVLTNLKHKEVALCKELRRVWETLDMDPEDVRCNCVV